MDIKNKQIINLREIIVVLGNNNKKKEVIAKTDTGAYTSSIDIKLAAELRLGPILGVRKVEAANGVSQRPVVEATVIVRGDRITEEFTLTDRGHLRHEVLLGRKLLKKGDFLVNPAPKRIR